MSVHNPATRLFALLLGLLTGATGIAHGVAEMSIGNVPAADILARVGAFTLLPTYLVAGMVTVMLGALMIAWSITLLHKRLGPTGFALIAVPLVLSGGGVAQVAGILLTWGMATRIHAPLTWWNRVLSTRFRTWAVGAWPIALSVGFLCLLGGVTIWLVLMAPVVARTIGPTHYLCWGTLLAGLGLLAAAIPLGFARDLARRGSGRGGSMARRSGWRGFDGHEP
jgi:hypothetical protein